MRPEAAQILRLLRDDFAFYAQTALRITDKVSRDSRPFMFNAPQRLTHVAAEKMRQELGYVRLMVVKARQQGISTYIGGRGYWKSTLNPHRSAFILTHEMKATENLFRMVQSYHLLCPAPLRPHTTVDAANKLTFGKIGSGYEIATARTKAAGRSFNVQFFHGSEVAFWPSLVDNMAGIGQALALAPDTEGFLESTGNGRNEFYQMVQFALRGQSDYRVAFSPWFISEEYRRPVPTAFELSEEDWEYAETFGLSLEQMAWRQRKIATDFAGDATLFDQEYPATLQRAFRRSATEAPFIQLKTVERARRVTQIRRGAKRLGIDPSQGMKKSDRFAFVERDDGGVYWTHTIQMRTDDTMEAVGICARIIKDRNPDAVFIDRLGLGAGICDRLVELFPDRIIIGVKASEESSQPEKYVNKRTEMWGEGRDFLINGGGCVDDDEFESDLTGPSFKYRNGVYLLESKAEMYKRGLPSPDLGDAYAHTFYVPIELASALSQEDRRSGAAGHWKTQ